ncbi:MAG: hypothetical protein NT013_25540 [Planctomycetia bacterium]|nr:hypothetical protein [Planctomycetia bacterium]
MESTIAFLSQGRLFVKESGKPIREVESRFANDAMDRQAKDRNSNAWRARSGVWGNMGMAPPKWSQWEGEDTGDARRRIRFAGLARGSRPGTLLYVLDMENVNGLFEYDLNTNIEKRLIHRNGFVARDLVCHPDCGELAISMSREDGSSHLAVSDSEGRFWNHVAGGDSLDQMPSWVAGDGRKLVCQSAAIGRNQAGNFRGIGPYAIERFDLDHEGKVETVLSDEHSDLLQPTLLPDGSPLLIRRPYKPLGQQRVDPIEFLKDICLFPLRLLRAIGYFLNFFSMMFSGKPLATSMGQRQPTAQDRGLMLWGHMIDTKRALRQAEKGRGEGLVPRDWQMVRRATDNSEVVIAENVLAYDRRPNGQLIYTNGTVIYALSDSGERTELCRDSMIEKIICVS